MIIESHPEQYNGYPFITLIQFNEQHILTVIDNYDRKVLRAYVLDYCEAEQIDEVAVVAIANEWYGDGSPTYPVSIEFSKREVVSEFTKIYRSFAVDNITRVIGPVFAYDMDTVFKIKRKRRVPVGNNVISLRLGSRNL